jgi:hypothetical protein
MFDSKPTMTGRLTNAVDLLIDFATLGEYGMEPVERRGSSCESRLRRASAPARHGRIAQSGHGVPLDAR